MWNSDPHYAALLNLPKMSVAKCKECQCVCSSCGTSNSLEYHHEIEELRTKLRDSKNIIAKLESELDGMRVNADNQNEKQQDDFARLRDRYDRLFESHKKLSKLNHTMEDNLLALAGRTDNEMTELRKQIVIVNNKLLDSQMTTRELEEENDRYRADCNLAVQLLHTKPTEYVAQRLNSFPIELQERLRKRLSDSQCEELEAEEAVAQAEVQNRMPVPTFPPMMVVPPLNNGSNRPSPALTRDSSHSDLQQLEESTVPHRGVPISLVAQVLTQPEPSRQTGHRVFYCTQCLRDVSMRDCTTQTATNRLYIRKDQSKENTCIPSAPPKNVPTIAPNSSCIIDI